MRLGLQDTELSWGVTGFLSRPHQPLTRQAALKLKPSHVGGDKKGKRTCQGNPDSCNALRFDCAPFPCPCNPYLSCPPSIPESVPSPDTFLLCPCPQVVFVSSDSSAAEFEEYYSEMPWTAMPFSASTEKAALSKRFGVSSM